MDPIHSPAIQALLAGYTMIESTYFVDTYYGNYTLITAEKTIVSPPTANCVFRVVAKVKDTDRNTALFHSAVIVASKYTIHAAPRTYDPILTSAVFSDMSTLYNVIVVSHDSMYPTNGVFATADFIKGVFDYTPTMALRDIVFQKL